MPGPSENPSDEVIPNLTDEALGCSLNSVERLLRASRWEWETDHEFKTSNDHALQVYSELVVEARARGWTKATLH